MFHHLVLLTFPDTCEGARINEIVEALRALPSEIEAIRGYAVGRDAALSEGNATVGISAVFDDADGWRAYQDHAAHQRVVVGMIRPAVSARSAVQFTSD